MAGKNILPPPPAQPRVPSTNVAFGRGVTTLRKKSATTSASPTQQQQASSQTSSRSTTTAVNKSTTSSIIRRSGSVGQLTENGRRHLPLPLPVPVHSVTPSASFNHTQAASTGGGQRCQCRNGACKCVPSMAFLEGVYVQNLQTQIEVLELENAYL
jgi:hypothetical protein